MGRRITFEEYKVTRGGEVYSPFRKLKPGKGSHGYLTVNLCGISRLVHRLVAEKYIPNPEGKRTVNHIDGDKLNNNVDNLEWATDSENNKHAFDKLGRTSRPKLKVDDHDAYGILILKGQLKQREIASIFSCKRTRVADIHAQRRAITGVQSNMRGMLNDRCYC